MDRGLVNLLRGIVGYVRNPEQHEESFVRGLLQIREGEKFNDELVCE